MMSLHIFVTVNSKFYTSKWFRSLLQGNVQYHVGILTTYHEMEKEKNKISVFRKISMF